MNSRRGSTISPIRVEKISLASIGIIDTHLQQRAHVRIERGFPQLFRVHFPETFIALDLQTLAGIFNRSVIEAPRPGRGRDVFALGLQRAGPGEVFIHPAL